MIAPDTNVLVRLLVADDPGQSAQARALFERGNVMLLKTVLLETEWVLRARYDLDRSRIATYFRNLAETDGISMEHEDACRAAISAYAGGMGFADALHAATAVTMDIEFQTFDDALVGKAKKLLGAGVLLK